MHANAESAVGTIAETLILRLLYQLILILVVSRLVVLAVRRLRQTDVAGEILAGLVLGPSLLGMLAPNLLASIFHPSTAPVFVGMSQLGLVLLMFQIGLEFEFRAALRTDRRAVIIISLIGIAAPFALGVASAGWFFHQLDGPLPQELGFRLFFAVAMSITAIPILGRIFIELGLSHTRTAAITIGAAAIDDVVGWLLLGVVSLVVSGSFSFGWLAWRAGGLALFLAVAFGVLRPLLKRWVASGLHRHGQLRPSAVAPILVVLFVAAAVTSNLGVFAIIGGFVVGVALHDDRRFVEEWKLRVSPLVNALFLPIFFAYTGLRTDVGALRSARELLLTALVCLVAFAGKFGGAYLGARIVGEKRRSALTIATCMNTRALMELVALNVGYDLGVLPRTMFTKLVLMAIGSTYLATPLIRRFMRGQERREERRAKSVRLSLQLSDAAEWSGIERSRLALVELLGRAMPEPERCGLVAMVAAELLENAHKYGPERPSASPELSVDVGDERVSVAVTGERGSERALARLEEHVAWVSSFADPAAAFREAVDRAAGGASGGLGLARIAHAGQARLQVFASGARVTVQAELPTARPSDRAKLEQPVAAHE